ncbi:hypothetical protein B0H03_102207 [Rathayibacter iranicus NCPPB 2253 = VKM Ac-1602]|uniref:Uncharacterized protein n=1 Tax=Rathayibacter iranicus NCPPB 2253 = VKM Ac-1602 TaxID=1328868 RepID=A0ABX5LFB4_9MICO|nr:hypothetical protein B0H03_102207 [Rathayibacter iranicus NCPPB 2253 = VKM Ac-1602]
MPTRTRPPTETPTSVSTQPFAPRSAKRLRREANRATAGRDRHANKDQATHRNACQRFDAAVRAPLCKTSTSQSQPHHGRQGPPCQQGPGDPPKRVPAFRRSRSHPALQNAYVAKPTAPRRAGTAVETRTRRPAETRASVSAQPFAPRSAKRLRREANRATAGRDRRGNKDQATRRNACQRFGAAVRAPLCETFTSRSQPRHGGQGPPWKQGQPQLGPPPARAAAPRMPALLRRAAGTIGVRSSRSGRNSSWCFEMPPPTMKRSGQSRASRCE